MNATQLFGVLAAHPYPGTTDLRLNGVGCCFVVGNVEMRYDLDGWRAQGRVIPAEWTIPDDFLSDAARVHVEIRRVLALLDEPIATPHEKPADAPLIIGAKPTVDILRTAIESIAEHVGAEPWAPDEVKGKVAEVTDARDALSEIASLCGVRLPATPAQTVEAVSALLAERDSLKARLRGAEGSIETLSGLLDVLAAPVAFGERRLSPAERAEWALRRWLAEGRASDTRIAQLIEAEVYLDVRGVPAYAAVPGDDPGDASEALTLPERLRLHFGAQS